MKMYTFLNHRVLFLCDILCISNMDLIQHDNVISHGPVDELITNASITIWSNEEAKFCWIVLTVRGLVCISHLKSSDSTLIGMILDQF